MTTEQQAVSEHHHGDNAKKNFTFSLGNECHSDNSSLKLNTDASHRTCSDTSVLSENRTSSNASISSETVRLLIAETSFPISSSRLASFESVRTSSVDSAGSNHQLRKVVPRPQRLTKEHRATSTESQKLRSFIREEVREEVRKVLRELSSSSTHQYDKVTHQIMAGEPSSEEEAEDSAEETTASEALQRVYVTATGVRELDVLCERGENGNSHHGNMKFHQLVDKRKVKYKRIPHTAKDKKSEISGGVVKEVYKYGGRFLKKVGELEGKALYYVMNFKEARKKAASSLREKKYKRYPNLKKDKSTA